MIPALTFLDACHAQGFRFITGTPCSYLKALIHAAIGDERFLFRDAVNEGDAVAMALRTPLAAGLRFVHFCTRPGAPEKLPRPSVTPTEVFGRLRDWLAES